MILYPVRIKKSLRPHKTSLQNKRNFSMAATVKSTTKD